MQADSYISDRVLKAEEILAGQLGTIEALQDVLGRSHDGRADVAVSLVKARMAIAEIGSALDAVEALFAG